MAKIKVKLPQAPSFESAKAVKYYLHTPTKFSTAGSNLALKGLAFFLNQPSFQKEHNIKLK